MTLYITGETSIQCVLHKRPTQNTTWGYAASKIGDLLKQQEGHAVHPSIHIPDVVDEARQMLLKGSGES